MYYNVAALKTDGTGASLVTAGIPDVTQAGDQADQMNRAAMQIMGSTKPGAERAIPDMIYTAGYGPNITDPAGAALPPYHGEISPSTATLLDAVQERLAQYGEAGVVRFSAREAAVHVPSDHPVPEGASALARIFDKVPVDAEIIEKTQPAKPAARPGGFTP